MYEDLVVRVTSWLEAMDAVHTDMQPHSMDITTDRTTKQLLQMTRQAMESENPATALLMLYVRLGDVHTHLLEKKRDLTNALTENISVFTLPDEELIALRNRMVQSVLAQNAIAVWLKSINSFIQELALPQLDGLQA